MSGISDDKEEISGCRDLVIGIGCRKGTSAEAIESSVLKWLSDEKISFERVKYAASIDIKKNEKGLNDFCEKHGFSLITFSAEQLSAVSGDFTSSEFVKKTTGADNVCERSAVLASGGELVMRKHAGSGVTCAAAEIRKT